MALFDELNGIIAHGLQPLAAYRLSLEVERALSCGRLEALFMALSQRWARLTPLVLVTGSNRDRQQQIMRMLKTIFEALASAHRSGTILAVNPKVDGNGATPEARRFVEPRSGCRNKG